MKYISDYHKMLKLENLYEYLEYKSNQYSNCFAVQEYRDGRIFSHTYQELLNDVKKFGNFLIENDIHRKHVSIIGSFSYEWLVSFFSVLYSNNVAVPIDGGQSNERIHNLLNAADVGVIISRQRIRPDDRDNASGRTIYFDEVNKIIASCFFEF